MLDNPLIQLLRTTILNGLTVRGFTNVSVKQANQPTQQGVDYGPTVYLTKIGDTRYGFLKRDDEWDPINSEMVHREIQLYESTFQVNALSIQSAEDTTSITASDLLNTVAATLQGDVGRDGLAAAGIGILRVQEIRQVYWKDDRDQFEASPSFDFVITHDQTYVATNPIIGSIEFNIKRV